MTDDNAILLEQVGDEMEMLSEGWYQYYNRITGEFISYHSDFPDNDIDPEDFESEEYIALPNQRDINGYEIMVDFVQTVKDSHTSELLEVALNGSGAFRRFKDIVRRMGLDNKWFEFQRNAFMEIAKEWCENHNILYR